MQILMLLMMMAALLAGVPLASTRLTPTRVVAYDERANGYTTQVETYASAAWATNATTPGTIARASMSLPANYSDLNSEYPNQAFSDGTYIWIWSGNPDPASQRLDAFQGNAQVEVGIAATGTVTWRDGTTAAPPSVIPANCLVIRVPVL